MLLKWFKPARPALRRTRLPLDLERALRNINDLPALSDTAVRSLRLANDPQSTLGDYANLIKRDGSLATAVLRVANSSLFRIGPPVADLQHAVLRLGLRNCSQLVTTLGLRGLTRGAMPNTRKRCEILWRHGFLTACLSTHLCQFLQMDFTGEEFSGGLLHDLGRMLIAVAVPEFADQIDPLDFDETEERLAAEREQLETDHAQIGAAYCRRLGLPSALTGCNEHHHAPIEAMDAKHEHRRLIALVAVADDVANTVQRTHQIRDYDLDTSPGYVALTNGWTLRSVNLAEQLPQLVVRALRMTRALLKCQVT